DLDSYRGDVQHYVSGTLVCRTLRIPWPTRKPRVNTVILSLLDKRSRRTSTDPELPLLFVQKNFALPTTRHFDRSGPAFCTSIGLPVGGTPKNVPRCAPRMVNRAAA